MIDVNSIPVQNTKRAEQFQISVSQNGFHLSSTSLIPKSSPGWLLKVHQVFYEKFPPSEGYKIKIKVKIENIGEVAYEDAFTDAHL